MTSSGQPAVPADTAVSRPPSAVSNTGARCVPGIRRSPGCPRRKCPPRSETLPATPRRRHVAQLGDVDRGQHRVPGPVLLAIGGLDPGAAAPVEQQPGDPPFAQHGAAVIGQVAGQRVGQRAGTAGQDRPATLLPAEDQRVGEHARAGQVHGLIGLEGHPQHERLDVPVGELVPDHVPGDSMAGAARSCRAGARPAAGRATGRTRPG